MSMVVRLFCGAEIEVTAKATRRRFTPDYKRKIVREADGCKTSGAVGALLRREGLYSSHLTTWRRGPRAWGSGRADGREEARPRAARSRSARQADRRVGAIRHVLAETGGAGRSPDRGPKKHRGVAGDAGEHRALLIATVTAVGCRFGIAPTCAAPGLLRAPNSRHRRAKSAPPLRRPPPRALSDAER